MGVHFVLACSEEDHKLMNRTGSRPSRFPPLLLVLVTAFLLPTACVSEAGSSADLELSDSADVRTIHSRLPRWNEGEEWVVGSEPRVVVGDLNGPEELQLVEVSAAARQSDGNLVVADRRVKTVRLYGPSGAFLRRLGGVGSGPGEFQNPSIVLVTTRDSVLVWDAQHFRVTRFDGEGDLAAVHTVDMARIAKAVDPPLYPGSVEALGDGQLLVRLIKKEGKGSPLPGIARRGSGVLRVAEDLSTIDTLAFFPGLEEFTVDAPWGPFPMEIPLARRTFMAHTSGPLGSCIGVQEFPFVDCFGRGGERLRIRWSHDLPPVREGEIEGWRSRITRQLGQKVGEGDIRRMLDAVPLPEVRPPHAGLTFDAVGNLWVEIGPTGEGRESTVEFLVFDPEGIWLGVVHLPPIQVMEIGSDYVLGVFEDELEVQYLHEYALRKPT
jgi:hypothetical protein